MTQAAGLVDLDRHREFGEVDPADALGDLEVAPGQWAAAGELGVEPLDLTGVDHVVLTGMGGSGISTDIVAELGAAASGVPLIVHKGYGLPAFVGPRSLLVAVSCSGDTEETRLAAETALERGARLFAVARGGRLGELCHDRGLPWVRIATTCPPRHSLGMLVVPVLTALGLAGDLPEALKVLEAVAERCNREVPVADNPAKQLGLRFAQGGSPVIYGGQGLGAVVAYRLKCQLNENAKLPASFAYLPEAGHNEVVGWQEPVPGATGPRGGLVLVRDPDGEHPRVARILDVAAELLAERFDWQQSLVAEGQAPLARLASLLLLADFASVYAALALGRDPSPIGPIERLKAALDAQP